MPLLISNSTKTKIPADFFQRLILAAQKKLAHKFKNNQLISLNLVGFKKIIQINKIYRKQTGPTDTISFAFQESLIFPQEQMLGEIFICLPQVKKNAAKAKISFREELAAVFVHSLLHLLGHTHETAKKLVQMQTLTQKIINWNR